MIGMGAEASTIARAEAADFFCNCGIVGSSHLKMSYFAIQIPFKEFTNA
jgi:hypothetical protein